MQIYVLINFTQFKVSVQYANLINVELLTRTEMVRRNFNETNS